MPYNPSSYIKCNGTALTRTKDYLFAPFAGNPQALTIYVRFQERGTAINPSIAWRVVHVGDSNSLVYASILGAQVAAGGYRMVHRNGGATTRASAITATVPAFGQIVELVGQLYADGAVQLHQSINGGAVVSGTKSGTLTITQDWERNVYINNVGGAAGGTGFNAYRDIVIVRGVQSFGAMRRIAGTAAR